MFHYPNLTWTRLQAEAAGIPQLMAPTAGVKEAELEDLEAILSDARDRYAIEGVYTGALASVYQKTRVEKVCGRLGILCFSPLWGSDPEAYLKTLVRDGFSAVVVSVSALGLDRAWLGRALDNQSVEELAALGRKFRFNAALEGGEGETFVLDCPLFSKRLEILSAATHWRGDSGYLEIIDARLVAKSTRTAEAA